MITEKLNSRLLAAVCGFSIGLAGAATAQNSQGMTQPEDHMEYEPSEGYHEEEWYDPSDWFDDDFDGISYNDTDYEYDNVYGWGDDYDYDDNYTATYGTDTYDADWWYDADREVYGDGYHDGYYDGFNGSENLSQRDREYSESESEAGYASTKNMSHKRYHIGYNSGFEDGQRDRENNYSADWTYYLYAVPVNRQNAQQMESERKNETDRKRGYRSSDARTSNMDQYKAEKSMKDKMNRVRGTIASVEQMKSDRLPEEMRDHTILRITMDDGETVVADLGPNAKSSVLAEGDRVTICGKKSDMDGKTVFDAHRLSINNQILWNTQGSAEPTRVSQR